MWICIENFFTIKNNLDFMKKTLNFDFFIEYFSCVWKKLPKNTHKMKKHLECKTVPDVHVLRNNWDHSIRETLFLIILLEMRAHNLITLFSFDYWI